MKIAASLVLLMSLLVNMLCEYEDGKEESTCTVNNHEQNNDADNTDDVLDLHVANKTIDTCV